MSDRLVEFYPYSDINCFKRLPIVGWQAKVLSIDTGIDIEKCSWVAVNNYRDFSGQGRFAGYITRPNGDAFPHGTAVASILKDLAPGASHYVAKISNTSPLSELLQALEWAVKMEIDILNLSLGLASEEEDSPALRQMVRRAAEHGVLIVAAAGNEGEVGQSVCCPADMDEVLAVGCLGFEGGNADPISNRGIVGSGKPNLLAPGWISFENKLCSGTSFSPPFVAGSLAAAYRYVGGKDAVLRCLYSSLDNLGLPSHVQGQGAFNASKFVEVCKNEEINSNIKRQSGVE